MFHFSEGELILINKEPGWTSFDVIRCIKPAIQTFEEKQWGIRHKIKIGHAGTLDPLATGLLIICTGKKTKEIKNIQPLPKTYSGCFFIGATTPTLDAEQPVDQTFDTAHITPQLIETTAKQFIGPQMQIPPAYSAIHINGKRAYQLARENKEVELHPKLIHIYRFDIKKMELPYVYFEIECSKGTYIRSIARDFGYALNSGAYLHSLKRLAIGPFNIQNALTVQQFLDTLKKTESHIIPKHL